MVGGQRMYMTLFRLPGYFVSIINTCFFQAGLQENDVAAGEPLLIVCYYFGRGKIEVRDKDRG
jgi:hypothetical protein